MRMHISVKIIITILVYCAAFFGLILFQFGNYAPVDSSNNVFTVDVFNDSNGKILEFSAKSGLFDISINRKNPLKLVTSNSVISCELVKADAFAGSYRLAASNGIVLILDNNGTDARISVEETGAGDGETFVFLPVKWNLLNEKTNPGQAQITLAKSSTVYSIALPGNDVLMFGEGSLRLRPGQSITLTKKTESKPSPTPQNSKPPVVALKFTEETAAKDALSAYQQKAETALTTSRLAGSGWTGSDGSITFTAEAVKAFYQAMSKNGRMTEASRLIKSMDYGTNGSLYSAIFSGYYLKYIDAVIASDLAAATSVDSGDQAKILGLGANASALSDLLVRKPGLISKLDSYLANLDPAKLDPDSAVRFWVIKMAVAKDSASEAQAAEASLSALAVKTTDGISIGKDGVPDPVLSLLAASAFRKTGILSSPLARSLCATMAQSSDSAGFISNAGQSIAPETFLDRLGLLDKAPSFLSVKNPNGVDSWLLAANVPTAKILSPREIEFTYTATEGFPNYILMYNMTPVVLNFYGANWPSDPSYDLYYAGYCIFTNNVTIHKLEHLTAQVKVYLQF